jgi:hypothetical protein
LRGDKALKRSWKRGVANADTTPESEVNENWHLGEGALADQKFGSPLVDNWFLPNSKWG